MITFDAHSLQELQGVHSDLLKLSIYVAQHTDTPFVVIQGMRSASEQIKAFLTGHSKIDPRKRPGRHMVGCAIDFAVLDPKTKKITWGHPELYAKVRAAYYGASKVLNIPIRTLEKMGDLGHIELPRSYMPDDWRKP